jgi:chorismate synthase
MHEQDTIDARFRNTTLKGRGRHDPCVLPRAVPIVEAALAIALCDALLEKLGGDSLEEIRPRLFALRQMRVSHLPMDGAPWRFGYGS